MIQLSADKDSSASHLATLTWQAATLWAAFLRRVARRQPPGKQLTDEINSAFERLLQLVATGTVSADDARMIRSMLSALTQAMGEYREMLRRARKYILDGDIIQTVLSQRFSVRTKSSPLSVYRSLRMLNPSPYMFLLNCGGFSLVGASPELNARCDSRKITIRPIAGTRRRGETPEEDDALEKELLADPKERAEHIMLVDLARNDVGRIAETGSVKVEKLMTVEKYSHVMHIVSEVTGTLAKKYDSDSVMRSTFPAGTLSGAPKIRAMQIISELEPERRGLYAGAIGYFSFNGNLDTCIVIRTILMQGKRAFIHAGAGIVADSEPEKEYQETLNKARASTQAQGSWRTRSRRRNIRRP